MKRARGEGGGARRCEIGKRNHETRSLRRCEMVETGDIHGIGRGRGFGPGVVINWELNSRDNHYLPPYLRSFSSLSLSPPLTRCPLATCFGSLQKAREFAAGYLFPNGAYHFS